jgi:hypothetical protein
MIFHRPEYARTLAQQLLEPRPLDEVLRSGLFLYSNRGMGKTTFVLQDFIPALRERGALTPYLDLWASRARAPTTVIYEAVQRASTELANRDSTRRDGEVGVQNSAFGTRSGPTLWDVFVELVRRGEMWCWSSTKCSKPWPQRTVKPCCSRSRQHAT